MERLVKRITLTTYVHIQRHESHEGGSQSCVCLKEGGVICSRMPSAAPLVILPAGLLSEADQNSFNQYWGELVDICTELEVAQAANARPVIVEDLVKAGNLMLHAIKMFLQCRCALELFM